MAIELKSGASADKLSINASGEASVTLNADDALAGFVALTTESHPTENGVDRETYTLECNDDYALRTTAEDIAFPHIFSGAAVNTTLFRQGSATATITQANGFLTLNAGLSTASGAAAVVTGYLPVEVIPTSNMYWSCTGQFGQASHPANCLMEWGLATHNASPGTGTTEPTDGVYFRMSAAGAFEGVVRSGGVDVATAAISAAFGTVVGGSTSREFIVSVSDTTARWWIDNACVAVLDLTTDAPAAPGWSLARSYASHFRLHNTGVTASAQSMKISEVCIKRDNVGAPRPFSHAVCAAGQNASQGQTGETLGSTANYANSANPTAAVPTNTTAALGSGLGGQFWETDTLAVTTDGVICSYQVPAATSALAGRALYITRVKISSVVQTALTGGGYVAQWGIAYGHTAVSLATAEAATTKAPRRIALGFQTVASAATALTLLADVTFAFEDAPLCVMPGEFVAIFKKKIGTAPSAGVIGHTITFAGYRA